MIYDLEQYVTFLVRNKITPNQYLFCHLIYAKDARLVTRYKAMVQVTQDEEEVWTEDEIQDLINKGLILDANHVDHVQNKVYRFMDGFITTPKFDQAIEVVQTTEIGEELWNAYPSYLLVNGEKKRTKSCDKDALLERYINIIKGSKKKHRMVMADIDRMKRENYGYGEMGIYKYVTGRQWEISDDDDYGSIGPEIY